MFSSENGCARGECAYPCASRLLLRRPTGPALFGGAAAAPLLGPACGGACASTISIGVVAGSGGATVRGPTNITTSSSNPPWSPSDSSADNPDRFSTRSGFVAAPSIVVMPLGDTYATSCHR